MRPRFTVVASEIIASGVVRLVVHAPRVARNALPGQFVIVRAGDESERIPLTVVATNTDDDTIDLVIQVVGRSTDEIASYVAGDCLTDVLGPLGQPSSIALFGTCVVVAGGVGAAIALPVARALAAAGNRVIGLMGARSSDHLILLDGMRSACDSVLVTTEDGSVGRPGLVTAALDDVLTDQHVDMVFVVGPVAMMRAVSDLTRAASIPTTASLNPLMVDGTGLCGGCRVSVGGRARFACVDGPEFDAHLVDFEVLEMRNRSYADFERWQVEEGGGRADRRDDGSGSFHTTPTGRTSRG